MQFHLNLISFCVHFINCTLYCTINWRKFDKFNSKRKDIQLNKKWKFVVKEYIFLYIAMDLPNIEIISFQRFIKMIGIYVCQIVLYSMLLYSKLFLHNFSMVLLQYLYSYQKEHQSECFV